MDSEENLQNLINKKFIIPIKDLNSELLQNEDKISTFILSKVLDTKNVEKMLLNFRRVLEMLIKLPFFVTTVSKTTNKLIAVRQDNFLQLLDDRYYTELKLSSFLDIFKIETNNYNSLNKMSTTLDPHIKLVINYIQLHYNTTFRKFMNRNVEYYYMYKFFFDNGELIKEVLNILNSYHYTGDIEDEIVYSNVDFEDIKMKITTIYNGIESLFRKIEKKVSN